MCAHSPRPLRHLAGKRTNNAAPASNLAPLLPSRSHIATLCRIDGMSYTDCMTRGQLRKLLERAGLSQMKAARLVGITGRSMQRYIAGDVEIPLAIEYALRYVIEHGAEGDDLPEEHR